MIIINNYYLDNYYQLLSYHDLTFGLSNRNKKGNFSRKKSFCVCHFCVDSTIQWSNRWVEKSMTPEISRLYFFYVIT